MKITKNKEPIIYGQRYFLEVEATITLGKGTYFVLPSGSELKLNKKTIKTLWTEEPPIYRCKDCKHAVQSEMYARNISCKYKHPGSCWDKMSKACIYFTPKEP